MTLILWGITPIFSAPAIHVILINPLLAPVNNLCHLRNLWCEALGLGLFGGSERNHRGLLAGLLLVVAIAEGHLLAEGLGGQVVQVGRVRTEAEMDTLDVLRQVEVVDALCATLDVGDGRIEDADAVELDAIALGHQLGDTLRQLHEDGLHLGTVGQQTMLNHVLGQASGREGSHTVDVGEPAVVSTRTGVLELLEHVAHNQCVCCHDLRLMVKG